MLKSSINVALLDEESLFSKLLKNYLETAGNVKVVFYGSDQSALQRKLADINADVLLTGLFINQQDMLGTLELIRETSPGVKILVLSKSTDMELISGLLDLGIHGCMSKMSDPDEILGAITEVASGKIYRNNLFTEALYWSRQDHTLAHASYDLIALDDREKRILQLVWEEKSNREIANEIFISVRSVEKIRQDLRKKTGIKSTIGLMKYAIKTRIILLHPLVNSDC